MIREDYREIIAEIYPDAIILDNPSFDKSIIGSTDGGNLIYHVPSMINELMEDDNISYEEASEFIDYNTLRMYYSEGQAPIFVEDGVLSYESSLDVSLRNE